MKLFYSPGSCSIGIHVILEEIGAPYETEAIDLKSGDQYKPPFIEINPKSKVPALVRENGALLTEFPVIANYLARQNSGAGLLPGMRSRSFVLSKRWITSSLPFTCRVLPGCSVPRTLHPRKPKRQSSSAARRSSIKVSPTLPRRWTVKEYLGGRKFSIADAALFYVEYWAVKRQAATLPEACAAHFERMMARPAVQNVLRQEGLA